MQVVPDVVDEHVDPTVRAEDVVAGVGRRRHRRGVGGERVGVAAGRDDLVGRLGAAGLVDIRDDGRRTVLGEQRRRCSADPVCRTGDDRDPPVQERLHGADPNVSNR